MKYKYFILKIECSNLTTTNYQVTEANYWGETSSTTPLLVEYTYLSISI